MNLAQPMDVIHQCTECSLSLVLSVPFTETDGCRRSQWQPGLSGHKPGQTLTSGTGQQARQPGQRGLSKLISPGGATTLKFFNPPAHPLVQAVQLVQAILP